MNPNPDIYPSVYGATLTAENDRVEWSYPISYLNFQDKLPFGEPMDGSNSYIGFDPTINDCYVGAAKHTVMRINPEDKKQATIENTTYKKKINYRLLMMEYDGYLSNIPITATYPVAWTNIVSPWFSKFAESEQSITYYNAMTESSGTATLPSAALSQFSAYKSYIYAPVTNINTDAILLIPSFRYLNITPTYDSQGNITNINAYVTWFTLSRLKPQDKSAAGEYYDSELWEKGFKDTIDPETGRITRRIIIGGARISDVRYGVNSRNEFAALSDNSWSSKNLRGNTFRVGLNILAEYYDEDRNAVIYEYPNGVFFSSGSDSIRSPETPWYQFDGSRITSYARMNPNDRGYYSSSTDNTGLMCNNDTNDLINSNTLVLPSNFVSSEEDGSRFLIHNDTSYYYFNSDGTISRYYSYFSSGRQQYSYEIQAACFPLKDLVATIASFGFFFVDSTDNYRSYILDDPTTYDSHLYRGKFDENGVSDGTWWQGDDIPADKLEDADYTPEDPTPGPEPGSEDENTGSSITRPGTLGVGGTNGFITQYSLTAAQIGEIGRLLWLSFTDADYYKNFLFTLTTTGTLNLSNLLDYFVSLRVYPFPLINVPSHAAAGQDMWIGAGLVPLAFTSQLHTINNYADYVDAGSCVIPRYYNDFRDYTHTQIMLYLPYCGTVQLNPADVVGGTLHASYAVDFATGGCTAYVDLTTWDGFTYPIAVLSGSIGADIPLTASNAAQIAARIAGDALNFAGTVGETVAGDIGRSAQAIGSAVSGDVVGAAIGVGNVYAGRIGGVADIAQQGLKTLAGEGVKMPMLAGGRGFGAFGAPQTAYVQIRRGFYAEGVTAPQGFREAYGEPYDQPVQVSSCTGFTVFANVDTSGLDCDAAERDAVKKMMQAGIYI